MKVDESLRLKRMAMLARDCQSVLDLGAAQMPNPFLANPRVVGLDTAPCDLPPNYSRLLVGSAEDLNNLIEEGEFDAIIAGELLEHLERPIDFLRACRQALSTSGRLILSTPNPNSPVERLLTLTLNRKYFYTTEHICLYPQRWLVRMLEIAGFDRVALHSGGFPLPGFGLVPFPRPWCHQSIACAWAA